MRQATVLLMRGGAIPASRCTLSKFVGLRQPEMIRQQSCSQLVRVCRHYPHRAPALRVREFTDDVISCVHLHLCRLDVRFIAQSSVKVDAQIHWRCCV